MISAVELQAAVVKLSDDGYVDDPGEAPRTGCHTLYVDTERGCVVALVGEKLEAGAVRARNLELLPRRVKVANARWVPIKVEQEQPPSMARLDFRDESELLQVLGIATRTAAPANVQTTQDATPGEMQRCFQAPIPGGAQIAPRGANWVGTLGAACRRGGRFGFLTNWHVAGGGQFQQGAPQCQPHGQSGVIGQLAYLHPIKFGGEGNRVDLAFVDCGTGLPSKFPSGTQTTVQPTQQGIGRLVPNPHTEQQTGQPVTKTGRTTGTTRGRIVGIGATSNVNYGRDGVARFVNQLVIRGSSGNFSGPGDSGSLILTGDKRPTGLLFAGGGGTTIANPIQFCLEDGGLAFY